MSDYRLTTTELLALATNRLADIDALIAADDTTADWRDERSEQLRLIAEITTPTSRPALRRAS